MLISTTVLECNRITNQNVEIKIRMSFVSGKFK